MHPEDRELAELEAAMVFYRDLIDLKLRQGEQIDEDHELCAKLTEACDAFQRYIEPSLTVE